MSVAAPYWSDSRISSTGGIYIKFISNINDGSISSNLRAAIRDICPEAEWAYIVTWHKMRPNRFFRASSEVKVFSASKLALAIHLNSFYLYIAELFGNTLLVAAITLA